jgi:hypothetical protein
MVKIAHQIREQLEYYRKNTGTAAVKVEDNALLDIKKSTRNLISLSDNPTIENQVDAEITPTNFLRRNNEDWEPKIEILDAGEVRKFQKQEERQNRYARRTR